MHVGVNVFNHIPSLGERLSSGYLFTQVFWEDGETIYEKHDENFISLKEDKKENTSNLKIQFCKLYIYNFELSSVS